MASDPLATKIAVLAGKVLAKKMSGFGIGTGGANADLNYNRFALVQVKVGLAKDAVTLEKAAAGTTLAFYGGDGDDTLTVNGATSAVNVCPSAARPPTAHRRSQCTPPIVQLLACPASPTSRHVTS